MTSAQIGAVLTWVYAAGFGLPVAYVAPYLLRNGKLPTKSTLPGPLEGGLKVPMAPSGNIVFAFLV